MNGPDSLLESLRQLEIAAEWFRVAYRMKKEPRENPHLYRQLQEMRKQLNDLEEKVKGAETGAQPHPVAEQPRVSWSK